MGSAMPLPAMESGALERLEPQMAQAEAAAAPAIEPQISESPAKSDVAPASDPDAAAAEAGAVANAIGAVTGRLMGRVVVIGADPASDTSPVAVLLARELAGKGKAVLLDLAFGRAVLSALGTDPSAPPAPGISDLVLGAASFGEIIARDRHSGMHFVTAGRVAVDAASILRSPRLA